LQYHKNEKLKLEYITDKLVTLLNYCVKSCKPTHKLFSEKVFEHKKKKNRKKNGNTI